MEHIGELLHRKEPSLWVNFLNILKKKLSPSAYDTWFAESKEVALTSDRLIVQVAGPSFYVEYIEKQYRPIIEEIKESLGLKHLEVIFTPIEEQPLPSKNDTNIRTKVSFRKGAERTGNLKPDYTFANFVVGKSNQLAYVAAKKVSESPGEDYNPLFIYGGVGLGKTHLLQAIGNNAFEKGKRLNVVYTTCEEIMNHLVNYFQRKKDDGFKKVLRSADILLIDDIQFLQGKETLQEEIFHTFNYLYDRGKQIVMTSDRHPGDMHSLQERLVSRFKWGLVVRIDPPDFETRVAILKKKAEQVGIVLSEDTYMFLARIYKKSVRELEGIITKIKMLQTITEKTLTFEDVKNLVFEEENTGRKIDIDRLAEVVADEFGISKKLLKSRSRKKEVLIPRQVVMYLAKEYLGLTLQKIGDYFGGKDHTTVLNSIRKVQKLLSTDRNLQKHLNSIKDRIERE